MQDKEIRRILIEYLKIKHKEYRIYQEKSIGASICDLMLVTNKLTGFEIVPDGANRIGRCAVDANRGFTTIVIPSSVEKIYYNDNESYHYDGLTIKAPAGSYAIKFAKKHGIKYEEI